MLCGELQRAVEGYAFCRLKAPVPDEPNALDDPDKAFRSLRS